MKSAALVFLAVLAIAAACLAAEQPWANWSSLAPVTVAGAGSGLREAELPPAILDAARGDLADLRLADAATGAEIPYVVVQRGRRIATEKIAATLFDRTYAPNKESAVVADFGEKIFKEEIEVDTAGVDFRRRVRVEGGDDGKTWKIVRSGALLYRAAGAGGFEVKRVDLPRNDFRYLRVTVFNGADDPARLEIREAATLRRTAAAPPEILVSPVKNSIAEDKTQTVVAIDAGGRNERLGTIKLAVADPNFWRRVTIFARDSEKRTVRVTREDGAGFDKEEDVPWTPLGGDLIYRLADDESLAVHLHGANERLFQLRIDNENDKPLTIGGVLLFREPVALQFQAEPGRACNLYFGNDAATAPTYDLARFVGDLRKAGVQPAAAGAIAANPAHHKAPAEQPWSERYAGWLWAALLAVGAGMAWLVWRQLRAAKNMPSP